LGADTVIAASRKAGTPQPVADQRPGVAHVVLDGETLDLRAVDRVARGGWRVALTDDPAVRHRVQGSYDLLARAVADGKPIYGVTTGFGGMANLAIGQTQTADLQADLLAFLSAGAGDRLPDEDVRAAMAIRANGHLRGASGLRWELIERFAIFLNNGVTPVVRELGSIGASGDLIPLAAIARAITGSDDRVRVRWRGSEMPAIDALRSLGLSPMALEAKEGLALVNGTSVSAAIAVGCVHAARRHLDVSIGFHALAAQALLASNDPFDPFVHAMKAHPGQVQIAARFVDLTAGSRLLGTSPADRQLDAGELAQDRYSLRCIPQFLGPAADAIAYVAGQLETEINSVSDNPLIDVETERIIHGGNFLAQYVATGLDNIRAHVALITKHVDAQVALLMTPEFSGGLPPSLVGNSERPTNGGLKGLQICGNSIMPLVTYHSAPLADRFPTHAEQFNQNINAQSFGAANLTREQLRLAAYHMATALLSAVQAVELRSAALGYGYDARNALSPRTVGLYEAVRAIVGRPPCAHRPLVHDDRDQAMEDLIDPVAMDLIRGDRMWHAVRIDSTDP